MSWQATAWASEQYCGGTFGKCLLYALANYSDMAGRSWASQERLRADTEMSERALRDWLDRLAEKQLITISKRRRSDGTWKPDLITLNMGKSAGDQAGYDDMCDDHPPASPAAGPPASDDSIHRHLTPHPPASDDIAYKDEQSLEEQSLGEPERENARARDGKRVPVSSFLKRWPTAAVDSQEAIKREWASLPDDELQAAVDGVEPFCAELKRLKRSHYPSGASYLRERKWKGLPPPGQAEAQAKIVSFPAWSREWWASVFAMADRGESIKFRVEHAKERGARDVCERTERMPSAEVIAGLKAVPANGEWLANWRPWFAHRDVNLPFWTTGVWVFLPGPHPPERGGKCLAAMGQPPPASQATDNSAALQAKLEAEADKAARDLLEAEGKSGDAGIW